MDGMQYFLFNPPWWGKSPIMAPCTGKRGREGKEEKEVVEWQGQIKAGTCDRHDRFIRNK